MQTLSWGMAALTLPGCSKNKKSALEKPNILFIMSDDHASHTISCYGSRINQTPNIYRFNKKTFVSTTASVPMASAHQAGG